MAEPISNCGDKGGGKDHAGFHGVGEDIVKDAVQLRGQKIWGRGGYTSYACGVLGRQGGDGAHAVDAAGQHGFQISLDTSAAAGITAGNGQGSFGEESGKTLAESGCCCSYIRGGKDGGDDRSAGYAAML